MRLVTFETNGAPRLGVVVGDQVIDVHAAGAPYADMLGLLRAGDDGMQALRSLVDTMSVGTPAGAGQAYPASSVRLLAPVAHPGKIVCVGLNYRDHVLEGDPNARMPEKPVLFAKYSNTVIGPGDGVIHPTITQELDYEAEMVVVVGKGGKHIARDQAYDCIAGYMAGQDVTARDVQRGDGQWVRGKSQDTFGPLGPYLVTRDEVPDPQALDIRLWVNGQLRQSSNTRNLIFDVPFLIEFISRGITLDPGDLIYTGTPPGVGAYSKPPSFLQVGDEMTVEIERLGRLTNRVVADPSA